MSARTADEHAQARRLEEMALNASGAFQSLLYDGWLLGYRAGPTKRLRCINPTYRSSLPLERKLAYCIDFYRAAALPSIFRRSRCRRASMPFLPSAAGKSSSAHWSYAPTLRRPKPRPCRPQKSSSLR